MQDSQEKDPRETVIRLIEERDTLKRKLKVTHEEIDRLNELNALEMLRLSRRTYDPHPSHRAHEERY